MSLVEEANIVLSSLRHTLRVLTNGSSIPQSGVSLETCQFLLGYSNTFTDCSVYDVWLCRVVFEENYVIIPAGSTESKEVLPQFVPASSVAGNMNQLSVARRQTCSQVVSIIQKGWESETFRYMSLSPAVALTLCGYPHSRQTQ